MQEKTNYDWDFQFTGGISSGKRLSELQIETIDAFNDSIYEVEFNDGSVFSLKTSEVIGLLSITNNPVKISVILGENKMADQKIKRRLKNLAEKSDRVIVENNVKTREMRLFPYLFVSQSDAENYNVAEEFSGKLDTPKSALRKDLIKMAIEDGTYVKNITNGTITPEYAIDMISKAGIEVPSEILELVPQSEGLTIKAQDGISTPDENNSVEVDVQKYSDDTRYKSEINVGEKYYDSRYGDYYTIEKMMPFGEFDVTATLKYDKGKTIEEKGMK